MAGHDSPVHPVLVHALEHASRLEGLERFGLGGVVGDATDDGGEHGAADRDRDVGIEGTGSSSSSSSSSSTTVDPGRDLVCYLRATSPFTGAANIRAAVAALVADPSADAVVAVTRVTGAHPSRFKAICPDSGRLVDAFDAFPEPLLPLRSESLGAFVRSGAVTVTRPSVLRGGSIWGTRIVPLVLGDADSLDINTELEFAFAEFMWGKRAVTDEDGDEDGDRIGVVGGAVGGEGIAVGGGGSDVHRRADGDRIRAARGDGVVGSAKSGNGAGDTRAAGVNDSAGSDVVDDGSTTSAT